MSTSQNPNKEMPKRASVPHWTVLIYWTVGLLLVHNVIPLGITLLSTRYGWVEARFGEAYREHKKRVPRWS